jgi:hypothetical protein
MRKLDQRRAAALFILRRWAEDHGFELGEIVERRSDGRIDLVSRTPGGREFGIGYLSR